jgi:hypothetical protein
MAKKTLQDIVRHFDDVIASTVQGSLKVPAQVKYPFIAGFDAGEQLVYDRLWDQFEAKRYDASKKHSGMWDHNLGEMVYQYEDYPPSRILQRMDIPSIVNDLFQEFNSKNIVTSYLLSDVFKNQMSSGELGFQNNIISMDSLIGESKKGNTPYRTSEVTAERMLADAYLMKKSADALDLPWANDFGNDGYNPGGSGSSTGINLVEKAYKAEGVLSGEATQSKPQGYGAVSKLHPSMADIEELFLSYEFGMTNPEDIEGFTDYYDELVGAAFDNGFSDARDFLDNDDDGVINRQDYYPSDPNESADSDGDDVGDNADAFPQDSAETKDSDNDGTGDNADDFPNDPTEQVESDLPGIGENAAKVIREEQARIEAENKAAQEADAQAVAAIKADPTKKSLLDIDGDGTVNALTDGILLLRGLFDLTGTQLVQNAYSKDATRTPQQMSDYLDTILDEGGDLFKHFDFDDNGEVDALTDGLMLLRYAFDINPNDLTDDLISPASPYSDKPETVVNAEIGKKLDALERLAFESAYTQTVVDGELKGEYTFDLDTAYTIDTGKENAFGVTSDGDFLVGESISRDVEYEDFPDSDNNGISDYDELMAGGDPFDSAIDSWEDRQGADSEYGTPDDWDGDGILNIDDPAALKTKDSDDDGIADIRDPFPQNPYGDSDEDGTPDNNDAFPFDPTEQIDTDGDGIGNNADEFDIIHNELDQNNNNIPDVEEDLDEDGILDLDQDVDPNNVRQLTEHYMSGDWDQDGIPNAEDLDQFNSTIGEPPPAPTDDMLGSRDQFNGDFEGLIVALRDLSEGKTVTLPDGGRKVTTNQYEAAKIGKGTPDYVPVESLLGFMSGWMTSTQPQLTAQEKKIAAVYFPGEEFDNRGDLIAKYFYKNDDGEYEVTRLYDRTGGYDFGVQGELNPFDEQSLNEVFKGKFEDALNSDGIGAALDFANSVPGMDPPEAEITVALSGAISRLRFEHDLPENLEDLSQEDKERLLAEFKLEGLGFVGEKLLSEEDSSIKSYYQNAFRDVYNQGITLGNEDLEEEAERKRILDEENRIKEEAAERQRLEKITLETKALLKEKFAEELSTINVLEGLDDVQHMGKIWETRNDADGYLAAYRMTEEQKDDQELKWQNQGKRNAAGGGTTEMINGMLYTSMGTPLMVDDLGYMQALKYWDAEKGSFETLEMDSMNQAFGWLGTALERQMPVSMAFDDPEALELVRKEFGAQWDRSPFYPNRLFMKMPNEPQLNVYSNSYGGTSTNFQYTQEKSIMNRYFPDGWPEDEVPLRYDENGKANGFFIDLSGGTAPPGSYTMMFVEHVENDEPSGWTVATNMLVTMASVYFAATGNLKALAWLKAGQAAAGETLHTLDYLPFVVAGLEQLEVLTPGVSAAEAAEIGAMHEYLALDAGSTWAEAATIGSQAAAVAYAGTGILGLSYNASVGVITSAATGDPKDAIVPIMEGFGGEYFQTALGFVGVEQTTIDVMPSWVIDSVNDLITRVVLEEETLERAILGIAGTNLEDYLEDIGAKDYVEGVLTSMRDSAKGALDSVLDTFDEDTWDTFAEDMEEIADELGLNAIREVFAAGAGVVEEALDPLLDTINEAFDAMSTDSLSSLTDKFEESKTTFAAVPELVNKLPDDDQGTIDTLIDSIAEASKGAYNNLPDAVKEIVQESVAAAVLGKDLSTEEKTKIFIREVVTAELVNDVLTNEDKVGGVTIGERINNAMGPELLSASIRNSLTAVAMGGDAGEAFYRTIATTLEKGLTTAVVSGNIDQYVDDEGKAFFERLGTDYAETKRIAARRDGVVRTIKSKTLDLERWQEESNEINAEWQRLLGIARESQSQADITAAESYGSYATEQLANRATASTSTREDLIKYELEFQELDQDFETASSNLSAYSNTIDPYTQSNLFDVTNLVVDTLAPDFHVGEYKLMNGLEGADDETVYRHYLSEGVQKGAPTNLMEGVSRTTAAVSSLVTRALTASGVDISTLEPEELKAIQAQFIASAEEFKPEGTPIFEYLEEQSNLNDDQVKANGDTAIAEVFGSRAALDERLVNRSAQDFFRNLYDDDMSDAEIRKRMNDVAQGTITYTLDEEGNVVWGGDGFRRVEWNPETGKVETYQYDIGGGQKYLLNDDGSEPIVKNYINTPLFTEKSTLQEASPLAYTTFLADAVDISPEAAWFAENMREMNQLIDPSMSVEEKNKIFQDYARAAEDFQRDTEARGGVPGYEQSWVTRIAKDSLDYYEKNIAEAQENVDRLNAIEGPLTESQETSLMFYERQLELGQEGLETFVNVAVRFPAGVAKIFNTGARAIGAWVASLPGQAAAEGAYTRAIAEGKTLEKASEAYEDELNLQYAEIDFASVVDNDLNKKLNILEAMSFGYLPDVYQEDVGEFWQSLEDAEGAGGKLEALFGQIKDKPKVFLVEVIGMEIGQELATLAVSLGAANITSKLAAKAMAPEVAAGLGVNVGVLTNMGLEATEAAGGAWEQAYLTSYDELINIGYTPAEAEAKAGEIAMGAMGTSLVLMSAIPGASALDKKVLSDTGTKAAYTLAEKFVDGVGVVTKETLNEFVQEAGTSLYVESALYNNGVTDRDAVGNIALNGAVGAIAAFGTTATIYGLGTLTNNNGGESSNPLTNLVLTSPPVVEAINSGDATQVQNTLGDLGITPKNSNAFYIDVLNVVDDSSYVTQSEAKDSFARLGVDAPSEADLDSAMALETDVDLDSALTEYWQLTQGNIPNDTDGDGVYNDQDAFPDDAAETTDSDNDGVGDEADAFPNDATETTDSDNDGVGDEADAFPNDATESVDTDNDSVGDNADVFPNDPNETLDSDNDSVGDNADAFPNDPNETLDSDNDSVGDNADVFPNDPNETLDSDNDSVGDNADAFPNDASETLDSDNDSVGDNADAFPNDASETLDSDNDSVGDNADAFPNDASETLDSDNDSVGDNADAFPNDAAEYLDSDNDGTGDNADAFPNDASETTDSDNDGTGDNADALPNNASETLDSDNDGVGDNADPRPNDDTVFDAATYDAWYATQDDDSDGVENAIDLFPQDASETIDSDNDGVGDNADADDDNDGIEDGKDAFPLDASETLDFDGDGTGDNADTDDDNDGVADTDDIFPFNAAETLDTDDDGVGDNADAFPQDATETTDSDDDGVGDEADVFPNNATETADTDNDGTGDNADEFPEDERFATQADYDDLRNTAIEDLDAAYDTFKEEQEAAAAEQIQDLKDAQATALQGKDTEIAGLEEEKAGLEAQVESLQNSTFTAGETLEARNAEITQLEADKVALDGQIEALKDEKTALQTELSNAEGTVTSLWEMSIENAKEIDQLNENISTLEGQKQTLEEAALADGETLTDRAEKIGELEGDIATLQGQKDALVEANNTAISERDAIISGLNTTIEQQQGTISEQQDAADATAQVLGKEANLVTEEDIALVTDYLAGVELAQDKVDNITRYDVTGQDDLVTEEDLVLLTNAYTLGNYDGFDPDADFNPATGMYKTVAEKEAEIAAQNQAALDAEEQYNTDLEAQKTQSELDLEAQKTQSELDLEAQRLENEQATQDAVTQQDVDTRTDIRTELEEYQREEEEKKKEEARLNQLTAPGRRVDIDTPDTPAVIQYAYDVYGGDSIFATGSQQQFYDELTPYSERSGQFSPYGNNVMYNARDRLNRLSGQEGLAAGGKVKSRTDEILRILGEE